jgi:hypothetical protein
MTLTFAIVPDGSNQPAAVFAELEDAIDWGLERFGADRFAVRSCQLARVERAERYGAPGPV